MISQETILARQVKKLEDDLETFQQLHCEYVAEKNKNNDLEEKLRDLEGKFKSFSRNRQKENKKLEQREVEIQNLKCALTASQLEVEELQKNNKELSAANNYLHTKLDRSTEHIDREKSNAKDLERQLRQSKHETENLNSELESAKTIVNCITEDRNIAWDNMIFYKNQLDSSKASPNFQSHIGKLESQLKAVQEEKEKLLKENSLLKGACDPDDCMICYQPLPISRCMTNNCKGIYHNRCITRWYETKQECTQCRKHAIKFGVDDTSS